MSKILTQSTTQLTAPDASTEWVNIGSILPSNVDMEVTVAAIDTNVAYEVQYSADASTIVARSSVTTRTANGKYINPVSPKYKYARAYFLTESGGTAVTLDVTMSMYTN